MNCKRCGAKIEKGCFFCDRCGQSVGTVAELEELGRMERARTKKRIFTVLITVIILVAGAYSATKMMYDKKMDNEPVGISGILAEKTAEPEKEDEAIPTVVPATEATAEPTTEPTITPTPEPAIAPASTVRPTAKPTPAPTPVATTAAVEAIADDVAANADMAAGQIATDGTYVYPSDTTLFSAEFMASLNRQTARLARNELYARYGLVFKTADLRNYFSSKSWYKPVNGITTTQILHKFNSVERSNHSKLVRYEKSKGWIR